MKFLKQLLYILLILVSLLCGLVLLCAVRPELTDTIADALYSEQDAQPISDDTLSEPAAGEMENPNSAAEGGQGEIKDPTAEGEQGEIKEPAAAEAQAEGRQAEYIAPKQSDIKAPDEVSGKNGYQAPLEKQKQVEDVEADRIQRQLGCGETGDGLSFDPLFYPYYAMLDEHAQHIYRQVYANAEALKKSFAPVEPVMAKEMKYIMEAVYNDHPELFWLDTAYSCLCKGNGQCIEIDLAYNRTAENLAASKEKFINAAQPILSGAAEFDSDADKEKYVHDRLLDQISYSLGAEMNQSAYSALVNGRTVCAGYARAFQYLMQQLSVPCYYCTGYSGESHAWNIIKLDDDFYNVDVTWDDTDAGTYDYYNKSDADYADTHLRQDMSVNLPPCNGYGYQAESDEEASLRSLTEAGFSENQVLTSLGDYYVDCYSQMVDLGKGTHSFENVIEGKELLAQWEEAYDSNEYKEAYVKDAMELIDAVSCQMQLRVEQLKKDRYLIIHEVNLQ